jgi:hypothetical protein
MGARSSLLAVVVFAVGCLASTPARGDVPPPDGCSQVGSACSSAGPSYDQPGTCIQSSCSRTTPDGETQSYPCGLCVPVDGGASPAAGGGSKSGCALPAAPREGALAVLMLLAGALALAWARRRATPAPEPKPPS